MAAEATMDQLMAHFFGNNPPVWHVRFHPEWTWTCTPLALVGTSLGYLAFIFVLFNLMKGREAFDLKPFRILYNFTQISLCLYMCFGLGVALTEGRALAPFGVWMPNLFGIGAPYTAWGETFVFIHYLSKFLDLFDTIFIVLRRKEKQLSFLHLYHHATIGQMWGLLLWMGCGSGTTCYGAFINSVIHVIMYSHYLWTTLGYQNPYKKRITQAQLGQFWSCILHAFLVTFSTLETNLPRWVGLLQVVYHITMITLFSAFAKREYSSKAKAKADPSAVPASASASPATGPAAGLRSRHPISSSI